MEKTNTPPKTPHPENKTHKAEEEKIEKEIDPDSESHRTSPDLIQKESHRLPVDDEVKKG